MNYCLRTVCGVDSMAAQDALLRNNWDKLKAVEDLKLLPPKTNKRSVNYYYQRHSTTPATTTTNAEYSNGNVSKKQKRNDDAALEDSDEHEYDKYQVRISV